MSGANNRSGRPRWVIKIGSSLLTEDGLGLSTNVMADWVRQMAHLRNSGIDLVIVSSGAVAEGCGRLGWSKRPRELHKLQAAAAVGQMGLVQAWESQFQRFDAHTAQILLVGEDVRNRQRYLNARKTINALLELGVVPVVNENDTVATDEIRFGDNDRLAALVANLIYADRLIIMTDQDGLYDSDPRANPEAKLVKTGRASDSSLLAKAGESAGALGRGGMRTKIQAARQAASSGTETFIVGGREVNVLLRLQEADWPGTHLQADRKPSAARKQWIAGQAQTLGTLWLDEGAVKMITSSGKSLLPVGVTRCDGDFGMGDAVSCVDTKGHEVARGLANYAAVDVRKVLGLSSTEIAAKNLRPRDEELIHRDNLVVL
ncbi:MAG: glutamate 5-kinase [Pseudomonadales bacterium]